MLRSCPRRPHLLAVLIAAATAGHAGAVTITTDVSGGNDGSVSYTAREQSGASPASSSWSSVNSGVGGSIIGVAGSAGVRTTSVFVMAFRLPERPDGLVVNTARLDVFLESFNGTPAFNVDLWGLGYSGSSALVTGTVSPNSVGFFNDVDGDGDPGPGSAVQFSDAADLGPAYGAGIASRVKLHDNLLTAASLPGSAPTAAHSTAGDSLAVFIQSLYDAGAVGGASGDFVLLRLSPDANVSTSAAPRYELFTNNDDPASGAVSPTLTLEFGPVPEPGSFALLGLGVLAMVRRRR